jgi:hypothetical protein
MVGSTLCSCGLGTDILPLVKAFCTLTWHNFRYIWRRETGQTIPKFGIGLPNELKPPWASSISDPASSTRFIDALGQIDGSPPLPGERIKAILVSVKPFLEALTSSRVIAGALSFPFLSVKSFKSLYHNRIFLVPCKQSLVAFDPTVQVSFP